MAKTRSPAYPSIGLKEAIEKAGAIYKEDYQNPITRGVAAAHMGYNGLNGKSLGVLSALIKYGLLEGRGDETKVSPLAVTIIAHPPGAPERLEALKICSEKPELFTELDARFAGGKASDQAIRSYLLTQKFIPQAADAAIRSYRETKALVEAEGGGYSPPTEQPLEQAKPLPMLPHQSQQPVSSPSGVPMSVSFTGDRLQVSAVLMNAKDVDKLIKALTANKALLGDQEEEPEE